VAWLDGPRVLGFRHERLERGHAERLAPLLEELAGEAGRVPAARIVVDVGPGSFTGARIGVAAARALGLAWRAPVVGVESDRLVATAAFARRPAWGCVLLTLDAGRGRLLARCWTREGPRALAMEVLDPAAARTLIAGCTGSRVAARLLADPRAEPALRGRRVWQCGRAMIRRNAHTVLPATSTPVVPALKPAPLEAFTVRTGGRNDVEAIEAVMRTAFDPRFGETWRVEQIFATITAPGGRLLALGGDGARLLGFSLVRALAGEAELLLLAIEPSVRRRGLGSGLLLATMEDARRAGASTVFLEVREDNHPARRLYSSHGFVEIGQRPGYYRGEGQRRYHAVSMRRSLAD
jgi:ribosomal-protein-alanine N-acetyltransferase